MLGPTEGRDQFGARMIIDDARFVIPKCTSTKEPLTNARLRALDAHERALFDSRGRGRESPIHDFEMPIFLFLDGQIRPRQEDGVDDGARTHDGRNHNPGLYQLSYVHHN